MRRTILISLVFVGFCVFLLSGEMAHADGKALFISKCAACHSIGGGDLVGPDLKDINSKRDQKWLIKFIQSSQALIKSGDAEAKAVFEKYHKIPMPDQNLTNDEVIAVLSYIKDQSAGSTASAPKKKKTETKSSFSSEQIQLGKNLFIGATAFKNKGASCIACHSIKFDDAMSGGSFAKDLTQSHTAMKSAGISAVLSSLPFPAMKTAYEKNSLEKNEIEALTAFLYDVNQKESENKGKNYGSVLLYTGIGMAIGLLIFASLIWIGRKRGTVNK